MRCLYLISHNLHPPLEWCLAVVVPIPYHLKKMKLACKSYSIWMKIFLNRQFLQSKSLSKISCAKFRFWEFIFGTSFRHWEKYRTPRKCLKEQSNQGSGAWKTQSKILPKLKKQRHENEDEQLTKFLDFGQILGVAPLSGQKLFGKSTF